MCPERKAVGMTEIHRETHTVAAVLWTRTKRRAGGEKGTLKVGRGWGSNNQRWGGGGGTRDREGGGVGGETRYNKSFVATSLLLQAYKIRLLSRQKYAREFSFVATKVFFRG